MKREIARECEKESGLLERGGREHTNANPVRSEWAASCLVLSLREGMT